MCTVYITPVYIVFKLARGGQADVSQLVNLMVFAIYGILVTVTNLLCCYGTKMFTVILLYI